MNFDRLKLWPDKTTISNFTKIYKSTFIFISQIERDF